MREAAYRTRRGPCTVSTDGETSSSHGSTAADNGRSLDGGSRSWLEPLLGHDLTRVRVHTDPYSAERASEVHAAAFTIGPHIGFAAGRYAPDTRRGARLVAHEVVHAAQAGFSAAALWPPPRSLRVSPNGRDQDEAAQAADAMLVGLPVHVREVAGIDALNLAPETWYRGEAVGVGPARPGSVPHDLGDGTYFTDRADVARQFAEMRSGDRPTLRRVWSATFERTTLGRVLDLRTDTRWQSYVTRPIVAGGPTAESAIVAANENYARIFEAFVERHGINLNEYETIIGRNYLQGGDQICVRPSATSVLARIRALLRPVPIAPPPGPGRGRGGGGSSSGGAAEPPTRPPAGSAGRGPTGTSASAASSEGALACGPASGAAGTQGELRVGTQFRVLSTNAGGSGVVTELEVAFTEGLPEFNAQASATGGRTLPARMVIRITQNAEGLITATEALSGEPEALASALARQAVNSLPRVAGAAEGVSGATSGEGGLGAAGGAARGVSPWVRGVVWGGTALFVIVTTVQLYTAEPEDRPRVAASAAGGFAAGALGTYAVCNLVLGIETLGWSLVICGFIAGGAAGYAGSRAAGGLYDLSLTPLELALAELRHGPENVRRLFYAMVASRGVGGLPINESFVRSFSRIVPSDLTSDELSTLTAGLRQIGAGATLGGVLEGLRGAISRLPRRSQLARPSLPFVLDLRAPGPRRADPYQGLRLNAAGGRVRVLPPLRGLPGVTEPGPTQTTPLLEIDLNP